MIAAVRTFFPLALLLTLAACANIPFSTMWKLSRLTPDDIATLNPAALGIALDIPDELALNPNETTFEVELFHNDGDREHLLLAEHAALETVETGRHVVTSLPAAAAGRHWHVLRLDAEAQRSFARFQEEFRALQSREGGKSMNISVSPGFANDNLPAGVRHITVALQLAANEDWFMLVRRAELDFKGTGADVDETD